MVVPDEELLDSESGPSHMRNGTGSRGAGGVAVGVAGSEERRDDDVLLGKRKMAVDEVALDGVEQRFSKQS